MKRLMMIMTVLMPLIAGCQSYDWLVYANPPLSGTKEGQECAHVLFGLGPNVDMSGNEAKRRGAITNVSRVEYHLTSVHGVGKECIVARGE
jgi:hypothetical protein